MGITNFKLIHAYTFHRKPHPDGGYYAIIDGVKSVNVKAVMSISTCRKEKIYDIDFPKKDCCFDGYCEDSCGFKVITIYGSEKLIINSDVADDLEVNGYGC